MNIHILVLVIAIILFGLLAFKQMSALILAPLVTSFVIICSGMPILDSLKNLFMPAAAEYVTSYFLVFFVGALFGAVYQYTGAAESIARAIARNPEILIFDDSFSALDYKTDKELRRRLSTDLKGTTCVIVAQRIGTIRHADKIIVLDDGKMAGIGTHEELMKNC